MALTHPGTRISGDDALNPRAGGGFVATADDGSLVGWRPPAAPGADVYLVMPDGVGTDGDVLTSDGLGGVIWATPESGVTDHGALTGLTDDDHTQYALLAGRAGGQTIVGGTASGNNLTLSSTSHATKGKVSLGLNDRLYLSNATGEDSIRLREYTSGGAQRGWVFTTGGVDRFYFQHDGQFQCTSLLASTIAGVSAFTLSAVAPALTINRTGTGTNRLIYSTSSTADWFCGLRDSTGDYVIETALGAAIRCKKSGLGVIMAHLPTADPVNAGELWNDAGTLKVSAG